MKNEQADCDAQIAVAQNDLHHNANAIEETHGQILTYTENKDDFKGRLKENQQELRIKQEELQKELFAVSEKVYKAANPQGAENAQPQGGAQNGDPNVYEADYTDVDDNNKQ